MLDLMYEIPALGGVKSVVITEEVDCGNRATADSYLTDSPLRTGRPRYRSSRPDRGLHRRQSLLIPQGLSSPE